MSTKTATEYCLGPISQIPVGEGREFAVGGELIAVFHTRGGGLYATQALCPHRNGPLIDGLVGGTAVVCPFHAWKFDLMTGEALMGSCGITTYPVRLEPSGEIMLTLTDTQPHPTRSDFCDTAGFNIFSRDDVEGQPLPASGAS